jgi:endo-1,4-beta-xylanase
VYAWDVVNEVASDTAGQTYRTDSPWYQAYSVGGNGADYIEDAFRFARAADPDVKLFLNDYSTEWSVKRENVLTIVRDLINKGVPIDGVGHQIHTWIGVNPTEVDNALTAIEQLNLMNEVTELDMSVYTDPTTNYGDAGPPQSLLSQQAAQYRSLFAVFRKHDTSIDSVTMWGIADAETWLDYWNTPRKDRPLLFDTNRQPKWAFWAVVDPSLALP